MFNRPIFFHKRVAPLPTVAKSPVAKVEAGMVPIGVALRDVHQKIVMTAAQMVLYGSGPARTDAERMERAVAAVAILQRAV